MKKLLILSFLFGFSIFAADSVDNASEKPKLVNITTPEAISKFFSGNVMSALKKEQEIQKFINNKLTANGYRINGEPVIDPDNGLYVFMVQDTRNRCRIKIFAEGDDGSIIDVKDGDIVSFTGITTDLSVDDIRGTPLQDKAIDYDISVHLQDVRILK